MKKLYTRFWPIYTITNDGWKQQTNKITNESETSSIYLTSLYYDTITFTDDFTIENYLKKVWKFDILYRAPSCNYLEYYRSEFIVTDDSMFYFNLSRDMEHPIVLINEDNGKFDDIIELSETEYQNGIF